MRIWPVILMAGNLYHDNLSFKKCVALSTTEAKYITTTEAGKEILWMKTFFKELGLKQDEYMLYCDS